MVNSIQTTEIQEGLQTSNWLKAINQHLTNLAEKKTQANKSYLFELISVPRASVNMEDSITQAVKSSWAKAGGVSFGVVSYAQIGELMVRTLNSVGVNVHGFLDYHSWNGVKAEIIGDSTEKDLLNWVDSKAVEMFKKKISDPLKIRQVDFFYSDGKQPFSYPHVISNHFLLAGRSVDYLLTVGIND